MTEKSYHISDILSVTTGALVSTRGMEGIYDIMGHIVGNDDISTIGLALNAETAEAFLKETLPWAKEVTFPEMPNSLDKKGKEAFVETYIAIMASQHGEYHQVKQMKQKPDVSLSADSAYVAKVGALRP